MKERKLLITETIRSRMIERQKIKGYNNIDVATYLSIDLNRYKYFIRQTDPDIKRYVSIEILDKLHILYDCTLDYLCGESNYPNLDKNGMEIIQPFIFLNNEERVQVNNFLEHNHEFLHALYYFLFNLPGEYFEKREGAIKGFVGLMKIVEDLTPFGKEFISPNEYISIMNALQSYNRDLVECNLVYSEASQLLSEKRYKNACYKFLELLSMTKPYKDNTKITPLIRETSDRLAKCYQRNLSDDVILLIQDIRKNVNSQKGEKVIIKDDLYQRIDIALKKVKDK